MQNAQKFSHLILAHSLSGPIHIDGPRPGHISSSFIQFSFGTIINKMLRFRHRLMLKSNMRAFAYQLTAI